MPTNQRTKNTDSHRVSTPKENRQPETNKKNKKSAPSQAQNQRADRSERD